MENQFEIKISGSGTINDIIESLEKIKEFLDDPNVDNKNMFTYEDPILCAEISEFENIKDVPAGGYVLPLWGQKGVFRATALAYMQRENIYTVENINGEWYSLPEIQNAVIGFKLL